MNYGLYLSASGAITQLVRQDVFANNLANSNTVGFKPDVVHMRQRLPERLEDNIAIPARRMLEMLGGGIAPVANRVSTAQGALTRTGQSLDVAIEGDGFLVVRVGPDADDLRLTRDGRLSLNNAGDLVMAINGHPVLNETNAPIRLDRQLPVEIKTTGEIVQGDVVRARLRLVAPREQNDLIKAGGNLLSVRNVTDPVALRPASGRLHQGHVEASAVDPIKALMAMTSAAKAVTANGKMMQFHDQIMGLAVNTLGRVT